VPYLLDLPLNFSTIDTFLRLVQHLKPHICARYPTIYIGALAGLPSNIFCFIRDALELTDEVAPECWVLGQFVRETDGVGEHDKMKDLAYYYTALPEFWFTLRACISGRILRSDDASTLPVQNAKQNGELMGQELGNLTSHSITVCTKDFGPSCCVTE